MEWVASEKPNIPPEAKGIIFRIQGMKGSFYEYESVFFRLFEIALCSFQVYAVLFQRLSTASNIE